MTKKCLKAEAPLTTHIVVDKDELNGELNRDIQKVCDGCSATIAEIDRLTEAVQHKSSQFAGAAETALEQFLDHRVAARAEWGHAERHMSEMEF